MEKMIPNNWQSLDDLTLISGQKLKTKSKKAISGFKIREVCLRCESN